MSEANSIAPASEPVGASAQGGRTAVDTSLKVKDLLWLCLSRWYWFVISLVVCCGFGVYYIMKTPPVYERSAALLIKDDRLYGHSAGMDAFGGMGFMQANTNVLNELASITSPTVMWEVVKRLGLDVNYSTEGMLHEGTLYGTTLPVKLSFPDLGENQSGRMAVTLNPDGTIAMTDFSGGNLEKEEVVSDVVKGHYNRIDTVQTPLGRVAVAPGADYAGGKLKEPMEISVSRAPVSEVAGGWAGRLKAEAPDDYASVITLDITDVNTERAEDVLQGMIDVYNENWIRDKNRIAASTSEFIKERLAVIEAELGNVDSDISSYKSAHMVPDVEQASQLYFSRAAAADDEVAGLNNRLTMARYIRDYLTNSANSFNVLPANSGLDNLNIENQISQYNQRLLERNNLADNSSASNPLVVDMDNQLAGMRQAILQSIDNYVVTLNSQVHTARSTQATASSRLQANPTQARYLLSVERQQKVKESLYLFLLQKREDNELSQAFTAYNSRVITPPMGSAVPVAPNGRNVMLVAVMLGLLIPLGGIYLGEALNTRVRGRKDLEVLSVPFVGEIPLGYRRRRGLQKLRRAHDDEKDRRVVMVRKGGSDAINEAFRVIRTNLELMADADATGARVIMLTSANPGSGKTFITMNLATVLAIKGKRVAVVDLDLRKGSLSTFVGSPSNGVSSYLSGHATVYDIIVRSANDTENLDLIPVGTLPPNPAEMLYSPRLATLIDTLRSKYDIVLLDCPPVEVVADAKIINAHADMTVFVVRSGLLERDMLPQIQQFYDTRRYRNMAIVLNGTDTFHLGSLRSTYGYGYGYGYGYPKTAKTTLTDLRRHA